MSKCRPVFLESGRGNGVSKPFSTASKMRQESRPHGIRPFAVPDISGMGSPSISGLITEHLGRRHPPWNRCANEIAVFSR
jgi:hypothetical protein